MEVSPLVIAEVSLDLVTAPLRYRLVFDRESAPGAD
jgi:hypothetical protein